MGNSFCCIELIKSSWQNLSEDSRPIHLHAVSHSRCSRWSCLQRREVCGKAAKKSNIFANTCALSRKRCWKHPADTHEWAGSCNSKRGHLLLCATIVIATIKGEHSLAMTFFVASSHHRDMERGLLHARSPVSGALSTPEIQLSQSLYTLYTPEEMQDPLIQVTI